MNTEDINAQVDLTSDIDDTGGQINASPQSQQAPSSTGEETNSVRELLENAAGRMYDPATGKFVAKPEEPEQQQTANAGQEQQAANAGQEQQAPVNGDFQLVPEYQGIISGLPEEHRAAVQSAMIARETAVANYVQQVQAHVSGYAGIEQVIAPRRQAWAMNGVTPEVALNQLFTLSDFASRDPQKFIEWFAANNNIDLSEVGETFVPPDPQYTALQQQVSQLTGYIQSMQNGAVQSQNQQVVDQVAQFAQTTDEKGQPKYPHFNAVSEDMLALIPSVRQQNPQYNYQQVLAAAYDRAVYANPQVRSSILAAEAARVAAENAARIRQAGRAAQSLNGGSPGADVNNGAPIPNDSVRGALEAAFNLHS